jgi:hypothetical protein
MWEENITYATAHSARGNKFLRNGGENGFHAAGTVLRPKKFICLLRVTPVAAFLMQLWGPWSQLQVIRKNRMSVIFVNWRANWVELLWKRSLMTLMIADVSTGTASFSWFFLIWKLSVSLYIYLFKIIPDRFKMSTFRYLQFVFVIWK